MGTWVSESMLDLQQPHLLANIGRERRILVDEPRIGVVGVCLGNECSGSGSGWCLVYSSWKFSRAGTEAPASAVSQDMLGKVGTTATSDSWAAGLGACCCC